MSPRRSATAGAAWLVLALALFALPGRAVAQEAAEEAAALTKSDLIRLLVGDTYANDEVAAIVRRSCLSFAPTERDREDLRGLGAGEEIFSAIAECLGGQETLAAAPDTPPPADDDPVDAGTAIESESAAGPPPLEVEFDTERVSVTAGDTAWITAIARRGGEPIPGLTLTLREPGRDGAATFQPQSRTTDASGRATYRVPAGERAGSRELSITTDVARMTGIPELVLLVGPGPPVDAELSPSPLRIFGSGLEAGGRVEALVTDMWGNPVPDTRVEMLAGPSDTVASDLTDASGTARLWISPGDVPPEGVMAVRAGNLTLAELPVDVLAEGAAPAGEAAYGEDGPDAAADPAVAGDDDRDEQDGRGDEDGRGDVSDGADAATSRELERGLERLEAGEPARAEQHFDQALRMNPRLTEAQLGLARAELQQGEPDQASNWFRIALREEPRNAGAWLGLGDALARSGRTSEARSAYDRVLELAPEGDEAERAERALSRLSGGARGTLFTLSGLASNTFDNGTPFGLGTAELAIFPAAPVKLWGRYDRGIGMETPFLVRGKEEVQGVFGGVGVTYGEADRLTTRFEIGRRNPDTEIEGEDIYQNIYRAEQVIRLSARADPVVWRIGGFMGRWFDRDDWIIYSEVGLPAAPGLVIEPSLYVGETIGTNVSGRERAADREVRAYVGLEYETLSGWILAPRLGIGSVSADDEEFSGALVDLALEMEAPLGENAGVLFLLRHQRPPGTDAFTTVAAGFTVSVQRAP